MVRASRDTVGTRLEFRERGQNQLLLHRGRSSAAIVQQQAHRRAMQVDLLFAREPHDRGLEGLHHVPEIRTKRADEHAARLSQRGGMGVAHTATLNDS
jgi:hypothetical protein